MFFLGAEDHYLEVEVAPHGQHLVLALKGERNMVKDELPLNYSAELGDGGWSTIEGILTYLADRVLDWLCCYPLRHVARWFSKGDTVALLKADVFDR